MKYFLLLFVGLYCSAKSEFNVEFVSSDPQKKTSTVLITINNCSMPIVVLDSDLSKLSDDKDMQISLIKIAKSHCKQ